MKNKYAKKQNKNQKDKKIGRKKALKDEDNVLDDQHQPNKKGNTQRNKKAKQIESDKRGAKKSVELLDNKNKKKQGKKNNGAKAADNEPSSPSNSDKDDKNAEKDNIVKIIEKGGAVVDHEVPSAADYYVLSNTVHAYDGTHFTATLNLSDLKNNNNKFYLIQIIINQISNKIFLWNRWGRVGYQGQNSKVEFKNNDEAIKQFLKIYQQKTSKGYERIEIDYSKDDESKKKEEKKNQKKEKDLKSAKDAKKPQKNHLFDDGVRNLLSLIFDINIMNQQMKEIGYDANKMPLGKLSQQMIKDGFNILREIEQVLKGAKKSDLFELSSRFYTIIPHNFGYQ